MPKMSSVINFPPHHRGQLQVLRSKARFKVIMAGRRFGKSYLSVSKCIYELLKPNRKVAYVTPTYALGKDFYKDIIDFLPIEFIKTQNKSDLTIELTTGSIIRFITGKEMDNHFRGKSFHFVVIDECSLISHWDDCFKALRNTLTDYKGDCWFISTPRGFDHFYNLYQKGLNKEDGYESFHFTTYDNPHIAKEEIDAIRNEVTEASFNQENLAIPAENANAFVPSKFIQAHTIDELSNEPTIIYGIDVASKQDYTVITGISATGRMTHFERFNGAWSYTKNAIKRLPDNIYKVMDSTGAGDPIYEELNETVPNLHNFIFTSTSKPQLVKKLALSIEKGELKFNRETAQELTTYEYVYNYQTGRLSYNAISGAHDDAVIAIGLCNYFKEQSYVPSFDERFYIGG
jgi:hypothetical protein